MENTWNSGQRNNQGGFSGSRPNGNTQLGGNQTGNNPSGSNQNGGNQTNRMTPGEFTVPSGIGYDAYQGSIQQILRDNVGQYVDVEFLIGTNGLTTRSGVLYSVGVSYIVLYDRIQDRYMICDLYSIKFVTIYNPGEQ